MTDRHPSLAEFPHVITLPLEWGDQDAFGHVNNTIYLRWAETARVEFMMRIGMWPQLPPAGVGPILASIKCDFKLPLTHPDAVQVGTRVVRFGNSSLRMDHRIVSRSAWAIAAEIESTIVMLDYSVGKPVRVPEDMRKAIEELQSAVG
jgi:acyl-CoA thioester hydrolase